MNLEEKQKLQVLLRRIQGQVGGVERMVEEVKSCEEILIQIRAAMNSLKSVGRLLVIDEIVKKELVKEKKEKYDKLLKRLL